MTFRVLLLARVGATAAPMREMERLRDLAAAMPGVASACYGFIEEGAPSLRDALGELARANGLPILIVPILLPAEPNFDAWLKRTLHRWQAIDGLTLPEIRIAPFLGDQPPMKNLLAAAIGSNLAKAIDLSAPLAPEGSVVPPQRRRVLVCMGGPCHAAGAAVVWGHLRNEQKRLSLRTAGDGTMSAKTSCLGPCSLAPVVQVWPEGTLYGGIDETGIDRIITDHLLGGRTVESLAYPPTGAKQKLRR
jgi:(2Fe-2S) ferredoxin